MPPHCSVVIPVYNSAPVVAMTVAQTIAFFADRGDSCEVILVNDGSTDDSWQVLREIVSAHPCVTAIDLAATAGNILPRCAALLPQPAILSSPWTMTCSSHPARSQG